MREDTENWEAQWLSPRAALSVRTRGREKPIEPCPLRTDYQRDRDRIIHCKSFRRLKYKTQVFLSPEGDHYRTRLTHTLEVSQIARTIARALRLNEDLTEAIALGHDLGHTPFGHVGESVLDELMPGGFAHNEQSRRIVEKLENGCGLNLTWEVRDGIRNHKMDGRAATLEGRIVSFADRIAYINHDIDDAIRAGVLRESQLPRELMRILGGTHGQRINCMILDIVKTSENDIAMSPEVGAATDELRGFMFAHVYTDPVAKSEESKAKHVIEMLYAYYKKHVETLPQEFTRRLLEDGDAQVAGDYIACMTDRYAIHDYERLFVPQAWTHA